MCGIVGYIGKREAYPILIKGLQRLEYRGYDSAGIALLNSDNTLDLFKCKGKVEDLISHVGDSSVKATIGIGHTRWATHGEPNDVNSHPHTSQSGNLMMIHNGIIENYGVIKEELLSRGYKFSSDTDSEVLINLIEDIKNNAKVTLFEAIRLALNEVVGAYAIAIISNDNPDEIICARKSSPLVIGVGEDNEYFIASDATPIVEYTNNVIYLNDNEIAIINRNEKLKIKDIKNQDKLFYVKELELKLESIEKGGFDHFMLKEIFEQPSSILDSLRGRLNVNSGLVKLGGMSDYENKLVNAKRIIILACGTSWIAGLVGEYLIEDYARIPVEVEYASEFRYRNPIISENDIVLAISQSGETADTLAAIELAKSKGATVLGICNVVGSSISRVTDGGSYTHAGPEIGVASTKAFTAQVTVLILMALSIAEKKGTLSKSKYHELINELNTVPKLVEDIITQHKEIEKIASKYKDASNFLYLGRGYNYPVALEGALKLKEISYIHAEGYPAAEMKHGPIALIDENMPVVVIANKGPHYEKVVSNIQEVKSRKGKVIAIVTKGDEQVASMADHVIEIPFIDDSLVALLSVVPLQLLSYYIAVMRGCNVDQPRNLAKSVTVE